MHPARLCLLAFDFFISLSIPRGSKIARGNRKTGGGKCGGEIKRLMAGNNGRQLSARVIPRGP
jgi:hypothetical protein